MSDIHELGKRVGDFASDKLKCKCGAPHDGWPGNDGGELCQICWEAECSESWWRMAQSLPEPPK